MLRSTFLGLSFVPKVSDHFFILYRFETFLADGMMSILFRVHTMTLLWSELQQSERLFGNRCISQEILPWTVWTGQVEVGAGTLS